MTGDVRTHFWDVSGGHVGLPNSSPYQQIKAKAEGMMIGKHNPPGGHSAKRWAKAVANDLLKSSPPRYVRRGFVATTMMLLSWLCPIWLLDWMYSYNTGMGKLKSILEADEGKKDR